jgi:uncharacterized membrane protein YkvA (DUF1232 family)
MAVRLKYWLSVPALLRSAISNVRLAVRLLREPRIPLLLKAIPVAGLAYVLSPLDFVPDVLPIVGQIDDLGLIVLAIEAFKRLSPGRAVAYHQAAIAQGRRYSPMVPGAPGEIIDAEWRRE